jgi:phosphatidylglycerophosphatase A
LRGHLNPTKIEAASFEERVAHLKQSSKRRKSNDTGRNSFADQVAFAIATCGVGLIPLAPGTWGSAVGVGLFWLLNSASAQLYSFAIRHGAPLASELSFRNSLLLIFAAVVTFVGIWAGSRVERRTGLEDPGLVVIDEVAGQLLAYLLIPLSFSPWTLLAGFLAFRLFDIWKPYPIRKLEVLESGLGIMADDILAGLYAAVLLSILVTVNVLA